MANEVVTVARLGARDETAAAFNSVQRNMNNTRKTSKALNQQFRFMRGGLGQVGHQVQDIAVQLQMGTNAMIVFGQQGSQIASLFGPQGAVIGAVLAVGAAIAVAFARDAKQGEDALKDLTERTKEFAAEMVNLSDTTRLFLIQDASKRFSDLLASTGGASQKLKENRQEQERLNDIVKVFNGRKSTTVAVLAAERTTLAETEAQLASLRQEEIRLAREEEDLQQQFKDTRTELTLLKAGKNPYIEVEEGVNNAKKAHKEFLDQLIFENRIFGMSDIDRYVAGLQRQLDMTEGLTAAEREEIQAQINLARSIRETAAERQANESAADREFQSFLQHQEALDRETDALERNRIAREKRNEARFASDLEGVRRSLLREEELERESLDRRRKILEQALQKEGADKEMLMRLVSRLKEEEAQFHARMEQKKLSHHDAFIEGAKRGLSELFIELQNTDLQAEKFAQTIEQFANRSMANFTDSFYDAIAGAESFKDAFKNMARSIVEDLTKMLIQYYITQQIFGAITGYFSGLSKQDGVYQASHMAVPETRATGGNVTGGRPYLVGEKGPELMVPKGSGDIIPNHQLGGGGVTVVQNINISTGVQQTVRAEVANLLPQISAAAKSAVADARMRGGSFSKAMVGS